MSNSSDGGRATAAFGKFRGVAWRHRGSRTKRDRWVLGAGVAVVVAALVAGGVLLYQAAHQGEQITAYFSETIGVYPGSTVRILGVPVGTVDAVQPQGSQVKVTMTVNHGVRVPASVRALVIAPSVVSDRYVQLTPAYTSGPQVQPGAVIPVTRTAVPVEVDQVYASLDKLASALGPNGANSSGALSALIKTGSANLAGNGAQLHDMITEFGGLSKTLGDSSGNLYTTISNLQQFTTMLKDNNGQVKLAEQQLAQVSGFLAADRNDLAGALEQLSTALGQVKDFIGSNRGLIKSNVAKLASITSILVKERASLAQTLDTAPLAVDNLLNAYDAAHHTLDGRGDLNELCLGPSARKLGCHRPATTSLAPDSAAAAPAGSVPVPLTELSRVPPLPLPVVGPMYGTPEALLAGSHR
ncbi:MAG TPA: MCE family protein [Streptosporangiaceae bacterium]|jgi:virulence factor Mce-like protein